jgi:hypothetical protein
MVNVELFIVESNPSQDLRPQDHFAQTVLSSRPTFPYFGILAAKSLWQKGQKQRKRLFYNSYDLLKEKQLTALNSTIVTKTYHMEIVNKVIIQADIKMTISTL